MKKKAKQIPTFKDEHQESVFWSKEDSTDFVDWGKSRRVIFPKLKPSIKTISLRLPESILNAIKSLANKRDVPYQSLMKTFLADRIQKEFRRGE